MDKEIKDILTKGLGEGYVGKSIRGKTNRAGFTLNTSDYQGPEGSYHDEWAANQNGGGQELVETPDGKKSTRVYAGGSLSNEELAPFGITEKDVIGKLVTFVNQLGEKTRLDTDSELQEEDWNYSYKVIDDVQEIPVSVGKETIEYKGNLVFVHYHIISPVR